jgi:hypothetical protein
MKYFIFTIHEVNSYRQYVLNLLIDKYVCVINWDDSSTDEMEIYLKSIDRDSIVYFNILNINHKFHQITKNNNIKKGYNSLIHHEFCEIESNLNLKDKLRLVTISKKLKLIIFYIKNKIKTKERITFDNLLQYENSRIDSLHLRASFINIEYYYNNIIIKNINNNIKYLYYIDSAQDSHMDLSRDGYLKYNRDKYVIQLKLFKQYIEKKYINTKFIFIIHPRREDKKILNQLSFDEYKYFEEVDIKHESSIIYSGASALALELKKNGFQVQFIDIFPNSLDHYYLKNSKIEYINI